MYIIVIAILRKLKTTMKHETLTVNVNIDKASYNHYSTNPHRPSNFNILYFKNVQFIAF